MVYILCFQLLIINCDLKIVSGEFLKQTFHEFQIACCSESHIEILLFSAQETKPLCVQNIRAVCGPPS